jgi:hypothetical protein
MQFVLKNDAGDILTITVEEGCGPKFAVQRNMEIESREERTEATFKEVDAQEVTERERRWAKTPKRSVPCAGGPRTFFWSNGQWLEFDFSIPELVFLPDPDSSDYQKAPTDTPGLYY